MDRWEKLGEEVIYERFRRIVNRTFRLPDGRTSDFEILDGPDTVAVLALTDADEVVLAREFRPGPEDLLLEVPGGLVDAGREPIEAARLELLEETGYEGALDSAGSVLHGAYSTKTKHVFVATQCRRVASPAEGELTEPVLMPLNEFREHLRRGRLTDVDAAYRALDYLGRL